MRQLSVLTDQKAQGQHQAGLLGHAAVRAHPSHTVAAGVDSDLRTLAHDSGHNFTNIPAHAPAPGTPANYATPACPAFPQRCPFGGACHACPVTVQAKLAINQPGDSYEQEADRIADLVMAMPARHSISGVPSRIQRLAGQSTKQLDTTPTSVGQTLTSPGRPLEPALRQDMEPRFGHDFSRVRVHTDGRAAASAREVNANAYTVGHNIVFGVGQFAPGTHEGRWLIAHELTHVLQQSGPAGVHFCQSKRMSDLSQISHTIQRQESGVDVDEDRDEPSSTPPPATATAGAAPTAEITLETGNIGAGFLNNLVHQQICIDRPLSEDKRCFSFAATGAQLPQFSRTWLGWSSPVLGTILRGEVYEPDPVAGATVVNRHTPTARQGDNWLRYMVSTRLGLQDGYSVARHNCRLFSQWEFRDAPTHW